MNQLSSTNRKTVILLIIVVIAVFAMGITPSVSHAKSSSTPAYKKCAGKAYFSKYGKYGRGEDGSGNYLCVKFGKASAGKIPLRIATGSWNAGYGLRSQTVKGTVKGNKISFKISKWRYSDEMGSNLMKNQVKGTITIVSSKTLKIKINANSKPSNFYKMLKPKKITTVRYMSKNNSHYFQPWG